MLFNIFLCPNGIYSLNELYNLIKTTYLFFTSAGGLVTAVAPVVIACKGLWIGWSGLHDLKPGTPIPEADPDDHAPTSGLLSSQVRN